MNDFYEFVVSCLVGNSCIPDMNNKNIISSFILLNELAKIRKYIPMLETRAFTLFKPLVIVEINLLLPALNSCINNKAECWSTRT